MTSSAERVVLVDDGGHPVGTADKATVHGAHTPRHLAFSCYGFGPDGRLLMTRRALDKRTFPGFWTNTCCGHPEPGERLEDAVARRLDHELALVPTELRLVLPDFSYRAEYDGIVENELCPVFVCRVVQEPRPRADEVAAFEWWTWQHFLQQAADPTSSISPWDRLQAPLLDEALSA